MAYHDEPMKAAAVQREDEAMAEDLSRRLQEAEKAAEHLRMELDTAERIIRMCRASLGAFDGDYLSEEKRMEPRRL